VAEEFEVEFAAVTAPVLSSSWIIKKDENDSGLEVELAFWRPRMAFMAARVLRYMSMVSSPSVVGGPGEIFVVLFRDGFDWSCTMLVDSMTSASNGKRSSRLSSHSWTNLVRGSVVKKGWWRASCVKGKRNNPPVLLSYFFKIFTNPIKGEKHEYGLSNQSIFNP